MQNVDSVHFQQNSNISDGRYFNGKYAWYVGQVGSRIVLPPPPQQGVSQDWKTGGLSFRRAVIRNRATRQPDNQAMFFITIKSALSIYFPALLSLKVRSQLVFLLVFCSKQGVQIGLILLVSGPKDSKTYAWLTHCSPNSLIHTSISDWISLISVRIYELPKVHKSSYSCNRLCGAPSISHILEYDSWAEK